MDRRGAAGLILVARCAVWLPLVLGACSPAASGLVAGYDFREPLRSIELPKALREVSSVAAIDDNELACLQDEKGMLYFVDLGSGRVLRRAKFGKKGDYEGLAYRDGEFWVLRSDGLILALEKDGDRYRAVREAKASTGNEEFEGLAIDKARGQLILAPKDRLPGRANSSQRQLYRVDPKSLEIDRTPWRTLDFKALRDAHEAVGLEKPRLRLSEVAVDPAGDRLWLLSAVDRMLVVVDLQGNVVGQHIFTPEEMPQPEGIAFLPDGRVVLASEGVDGPAWLRIYGRLD